VKRLRNDQFCVEWDVKPQLNQSINDHHHHHAHRCNAADSHKLEEKCDRMKWRLFRTQKSIVRHNTSSVRKFSSSRTELKRSTSKIAREALARKCGLACHAGYDTLKRPHVKVGFNLMTRGSPARPAKCSRKQEGNILAPVWGGAISAAPSAE